MLSVLAVHLDHAYLPGGFTGVDVFFSLGTLIAALAVYSHQDPANVGARLVSATLAIANLKEMQTGNYFTASPDASPLLHCWSLASRSTSPTYGQLGRSISCRRAHGYVRALTARGVEVVDVEALLTNRDGSIRVFNEDGRENYHDVHHLSSRGARLVAAAVAKILDTPRASTAITDAGRAGRW